MGLFKKKKRWTCYGHRDHCVDCGWIEPPHLFSDLRTCCPDCGNETLDTVVARFEYTQNILGELRYYRAEIKQPTEQGMVTLWTGKA